MTCLGTPFFQAGEEFARTKNGIEDSFKTESAINQLDWNRALEYKELIAYYKGLLTIRKHFLALSSKDRTILEHFTFYDTKQEEMIAFLVRGIQAEEDWWKELLVIYQNENKEITFELPAGQWQLLCDGITCIPEGIESCENEVVLKGKTVTILGRGN